MKKKIIITSTIISVLIIILVGWYIYPKHYNKTLHGIEFQLTDKEETLKKVIIKIDGTLKNSLFDEKSFKGTIEVVGDDIPVPKDAREVTINFLENGMGSIDYWYYKSGRPIHYVYGVIFINEDFSKVTILKYHKEGSRSSWTVNKGSIITAPADTRQEGLGIMNELANEFLGGYIAK